MFLHPSYSLYIVPRQSLVLFMHCYLYVYLDNLFFLLFFLFALTFLAAAEGAPRTHQSLVKQLHSTQPHITFMVHVTSNVYNEFVWNTHLLLTLQWTVPVIFIIYGCQKLNRALLSSLFSNRVPFSLPLSIFSTILSKLSSTLSSVSTSLSRIFVCKCTFEKCHWPRYVLTSFPGSPAPECECCRQCLWFRVKKPGNEHWF